MSSYNASSPWSPAWSQKPTNPGNHDSSTETGWKGSTWSPARANRAAMEESPRSRESRDYRTEPGSSNAKRKFSDYVDNDTAAKSHELRRSASHDVRGVRDPRNVSERDASGEVRGADRIASRLGDRLADYERRNSNVDMDSSTRPTRQWGRLASPRDPSRGQGELGNRGSNVRECASCHRTSHDEYNCPDRVRGARSTNTSDRDRTPERSVHPAEDPSSLASRILPNRSDGKSLSRAGNAHNPKEDKFHKQRRPAKLGPFLTFVGDIPCRYYPDCKKGDRCTFRHPGDEDTVERKTPGMVSIPHEKSIINSRDARCSDKPVSDNGWESVRSAAPATSKAVTDPAVQREPSVPDSRQDAGGSTKEALQKGPATFRLKPTDLVIPAYVPTGPRALQSGSSKHSGSASPSGLASPAGTAKGWPLASSSSASLPTPPPPSQQQSPAPALHTPIKTSSAVPLSGSQEEKQDRPSWPARSPGSVFGKPTPLGGLTLPRVASPDGGDKAKKVFITADAQGQTNTPLLPVQSRPTTGDKQQTLSGMSRGGPRGGRRGYVEFAGRGVASFRSRGGGASGGCGGYNAGPPDEAFGTLCSHHLPSVRADENIESRIGFTLQAGLAAVSSPLLPVPSMPQPAPAQATSVASLPSQTPGALATVPVRTDTIFPAGEMLMRTQQAVTNSSANAPSIPVPGPVSRQVSPHTPDPASQAAEVPRVVQASQSAVVAHPALTKPEEHIAKSAKPSNTGQTPVTRTQSAQQDPKADSTPSLPMSDADFAVWRKKLTRVSPEDFLAILKRDYPGLVTW